MSDLFSASHTPRPENQADWSRPITILTAPYLPQPLTVQHISGAYAA